MGFPFKTSSLRTRVVSAVLLGQVALVLLGSGFLFTLVRSLMTRQFDRVLETKAAFFATFFEQEGSYLHLDVTDETMPEFDREVEPEYYQVWVDMDLVSGGRTEDTLWRSESLGEGDLPRIFEPDGTPRLLSFRLPDGRKGRVIGQRLRVSEYDALPDDDPGPAHVVFALARGTEPLDAAVAGLARTLLLWDLGLLLLSATLTFVLVSGCLAPLRRVAKHVASLELDRESTPLSTDGVALEVAKISQRLNELTTRARKSFERERRTTANIAHELRTPVSELWALTDVAIRYGDREYEGHVIRQSREIARNMSRTIATLLQLARSENETFSPEIEAVEVRPMIDSIWREHAAAARARDVAFELSADGELAWTDRATLEIVLTNLLHNAAEYSPSGSTIRCSAREANERIELRLENPTEELTPEDLENLTEPFWRKDEARVDRFHSGLGLPLVAQLARRAGIPLEFEIAARVFSVKLRLPSRPLV